MTYDKFLIDDNEIVRRGLPSHMASRYAIEALLKSDDGVERAYGQAIDASCFVRDFGGPDDARGVTAIGDMSELHKREAHTGQPAVVEVLSAAECVSLGVYPGAGVTLADRILDGVQKVVAARASRTV